MESYIIKKLVHLHVVLFYVFAGVLGMPSSNHVAHIGDTVTLTCVEDGCQSPQFSWRHALDRIPKGVINTSGATSNLTFSVQLESQGMIRCIPQCERTGSMKTEKVFSVEVYSFPSAPLLKWNDILTVGKKAVIVCEVDSVFPAERIKVTMTKDGQPLETMHPEQSFENFKPETVSTEFEFVPTSEDNGKEIKCVASLDLHDIGGGIKQKASSQTLQLQSPPMETELIVYPSKTVQAGQTVTITCLTHSSPPAIITLRKKNKSGVTELESEDGKYVINEAYLEDDGIYECEASNEVGMERRNITITVLGPPVETELMVYPSKTVQEGQTVTIVCLSHSSLTTRITLRKKNKSGDTELESEDGKYVINDADLEDDGIYECESSNEVGKQRRNITITVLGPPMETELLVYPSESIQEGQTVTIICLTLSSLPARITLRKKNKFGATELESEDGKYVINEARLEDDGIYECEASNEMGMERRNITITVLGPPKETQLIVHPSAIVQEGQTVTITCLTHSSPPARITLRKKNKSGITELESEDGKYVINEAHLEDDGIYECEASNEVGEERRNISITVLGPPKETQFIAHPSPIVQEGQTVTITCLTHSSPPARITLRKKNKSGVTELESEDGKYVINEAHLEDDGIYECEASNEVGEERRNISITVLGPPKETQFIVHPSAIVQEGQTVTITCLTHSSSPARITLRKKNKSGVIELESEDGKYVVNEAHLEDDGIYECEASNEVGEEIRNISVTVLGPPKETQFIVHPSAIVQEGQTVTVTCVSYSSPPARIILRKKNKSGVTELESEDGKYVITEADLEDDGIYECEARNEVGKQRRNITITVLVPPKNTTVLVFPSTTVFEGANVTITCKTSCKPPPVIVFWKEGTNNEAVLSSENGFFTLYNVSTHDTGVYKVNVTNDVGTVTEGIELSVIGSPEKNIQDIHKTSIVPHLLLTILITIPIVILGVLAAHFLRQSRVKGSYNVIRRLIV
ncbi:vascular cell adhesion protein 1-like isoform X1 [Protopterus annectens]|uniref:vascular cell adhesion protein 1-like isoform X1 n=1 Tax=Protopterus annectens TaxID=7888 RepID=UPI001CFA4110|nr:vascular cell adhesion protein 1-like isoform X1 [Protopterus annectens]